jgi:hypothetical protein
VRRAPSVESWHPGTESFHWERVALFAAAAAVGPSFEPGLQPRRTVHQAIATGVISASTLSLVTATQSAIEATIGLALRGRRVQENEAVRLALAVGANALIAGASRCLAGDPAARGRATSPWQSIKN